MTDAWERRRSRAGVLLERQPHAGELLTFYAAVAAAQRDVHHAVRGAPWFASFVSAQREGAVVQLQQVPVDAVRPLCWEFVKVVRPAAPEALVSVTETLRVLDTEGELLRLFLHDRPLDDLADRCECQPSQLRFFAAAFVQPLAEALVAAVGGPIDGSGPRCPRCGKPPLAYQLRDEPDHKGVGRLVCSLCATAWRFRRGTCPACGEGESERVMFHAGEAPTHVAVQECESCQRYIKVIDARKDGFAEPFVDDIATVELDLWARERGLSKVQDNILGF